MDTSPYRTPAHPVLDPPHARPARSMEMVWIAGLVGLVTLARIVAALLRSGSSRGDLDLAWLVLFLALVMIWKEIALLRRTDPPV